MGQLLFLCCFLQPPEFKTGRRVPHGLWESEIHEKMTFLNFSPKASGDLLLHCMQARLNGGFQPEPELAHASLLSV